MSKYLEEYKRLAGEPLGWLTEVAAPDPSAASTLYLGGQADLTPLRNRAREAIEALNDALKAADSGKSDDMLDSFRRAKSAIDLALGGQTGPYANSAAVPSLGIGGPGRP